MTIAPPKRSPPPAARAGARAQHRAASAAGKNRPPRIAATLFGALAVIGGATALAPLVDGMSWLLPVAEIVGVIWLIGVGGRLAGLPTWAGQVAQLAGFTITITGLFTRTGIAGIIPGSAAWRDGRGMLGAAWDQVMTTLPPTPATTELTLLITITVGLIALAVDLLIAGARIPAMTAIPLLALYSVPASIAANLLPWYSFVIPAACYAALLATFDSGRAAPRGRAAAAMATSGIVIAAIAIGVAVVATDAATDIGTNGRIPHGGRSAGAIGLSPWAMLRGELTADKPTELLTVSDIDQPSYLRTFALERWIPDQGFGFGPLTADLRDLTGPLPGRDDPGQIETVTVIPSGYRDRYLPLYPRATAVGGIGPGWEFDSLLATAFRTNPVTPGAYTITADLADPPAAELRADGADATASPGLTDITGVPPEVVRLARTVTAGAATDFDKVDALLTWFTDPANGFRYSLATDQGSSGNALVDFLTERTGYCEQYAAAMTVLTRAVGIPARVGVGFTQGELQRDGSYRISTTNAHAWVEVLFADAGWVIFDPTPSVGGLGGLQGFAETGAAGPAAEPPAVTTSVTAPATTAPATTAPAAPRTKTIPDLAAPATPTATAGPGFIRRHLGTIALAGSVIAVMALGLALPSLARGRRRRLRLAAAAAGGAQAAWDEIVDTAIDHGITLPGTESARGRANMLARAAQLTSVERADLRGVVTAAEREWYAEPPTALDGGAAQDLVAGVSGVIHGLQRSLPLSRWRRCWPRSLRR